MDRVQGDARHEDIYLLARHLARRIGATQIVEVGSGSGEELLKLSSEFEVIGVDDGPEFDGCRRRHPGARWLEWAPGRPVPTFFTDLFEKRRASLTTSVVICHDMLRWRRDGQRAVADLVHELCEYARVGVVSSADTHGEAPARLCALLDQAGIRIDFTGWTTGARDSVLRGGEDLALLSSDALLERVNVPLSLRSPKRPLAIVANNHAARLESPPEGFRVVALVALYNEEDVLESCLHSLFAEGVEVYILDNWSTDRSVAIAERYVDRGVIAIEHFPPEGDTGQWNWSRMLARMEEIAADLGADWYLHTDADEVRRSPWRGVSLRDALFQVERSGFNAVDHTTLDFRPIDNDYPAGSNLEAYFPYYSFGMYDQVKTWKATGARVFLAKAGHQAWFAGRRVYPYNFLYKHFPIRSQAHGECKVTERLARLEAGERRAGWHAHTREQAQFESFLRDPARLRRFDDSYYQTNLVELIANISPEDRAAWRETRPARRHHQPAQPGLPRRIGRRGKQLLRTTVQGLGVRGRAQRPT